jgi:uncharacterized protein (TIGR03435 family)
VLDRALGYSSVHMRGRAIFLIALSGLALAQPAVEDSRFEAVSIHIAGKGEGPLNNLRGGPGGDDPEHVRGRAIFVLTLLERGYGLRSFRIIAPDCVLDRQNAPQFDIQATVAPGATREQFQAMLRNLLIDRFGLKAHREMREIPVYTLSIAKSGVKFTASSAPQGIFMGTPIPGGFRNHTERGSTPFDSLVSLLQNRLNSIVIDNTGLSGQYRSISATPIPSPRPMIRSFPLCDRARTRSRIES